MASNELAVSNGPDKAALLRAVANPEQHLHVSFDTPMEMVEAHIDFIEEIGSDGVTFGVCGHLTSGNFRGAVFAGAYDTASRAGRLLLSGHDQSAAAMSRWSFGRHLDVLMFEPAFNFHTPEWDDGYHAGRRGCSDADNPYVRGSRRARAWSMGLSEGMTKQLRLVIGAGRPPEPQPPLQPPEVPPNPEEPAPDPLPRT